MQRRTQRTRSEDGTRAWAGKIGVGVVTALIVSVVTAVAWEMWSLPHRIEMHEWIFRFHGWWPE